jgi:hypothetical protein
LQNVLNFKDILQNAMNFDEILRGACCKMYGISMKS